MARKEIWTMGEAHFIGIPTYIGTNAHTVLARNNLGKILLATTTISDPTSETGAGFAKGCLLIKTDAAAGTKGLYENQGTVSTASFNKIGDITASEIGTGAVTTTKLGTSVVTSAKIATSAVVTTRIADSNVTTLKINASAVTSAKIGTSAVVSSKLKDSAVSTGKLAASVVTSAKLATSAVATTRVADSAITALKIGANAVISAKVKLANVTCRITSGTTTSRVACSAGTIIGIYASGDVSSGSVTGIKSVVMISSTAVQLLMKARCVKNANTANFTVVTIRTA
jgi:hypothetical protein